MSDPSDGPTLTRLSNGGPGQAKEVATLTGGYQTDGRTLPQFCPLESLVADKLRVVYETGQGVTPPVNFAEGREPERSVRLRHARRKAGAGPLRGHGVDAGVAPASSADVPAASTFLCRLKPAVSC